MHQWGGLSRSEDGFAEGVVEAGFPAWAGASEQLVAHGSPTLALRAAREALHLDVAVGRVPERRALCWSVLSYRSFYESKCFSDAIAAHVLFVSMLISVST